MIQEEQEYGVVPVVVNIVDGGVGINFGRRHGLQQEIHTSFLHTLLRAAGFPFPETVRFERNKRKDGRDYVDWMRLRISNDECQVNGVNPADVVIKIKMYLESSGVQNEFGVEFQVA